MINICQKTYLQLLIIIVILMTITAGACYRKALSFSHKLSTTLPSVSMPTSPSRLQFDNGRCVSSQLNHRTRMNRYSKSKLIFTVVISKKIISTPLFFLNKIRWYTTSLTKFSQSNIYVPIQSPKVFSCSKVNGNFYLKLVAETF